MPGVKCVERLKVIDPKHQDDDGEGRVDFHALANAGEAIATGPHGIFEHGAPAVQAIFNDSNGSPGGIELSFQHARPALLESKTATSARDDPPAQGIAINEYLFHKLYLKAACNLQGER